MADPYFSSLYIPLSEGNITYEQINSITKRTVLYLRYIQSF